MMPATSLDPYTRLLASVADAITKARQSMHTLTLVVIVAAILCGIWTLLVITSIVWGPALLIFLWSWFFTAFCRMLLKLSGKACNKTTNWIQVLFNRHRYKSVSGMSYDDRGRHLSTQAAITDHSFLRAIFDTLPGVDADKALDRVHRLPLFRLACPSVPFGSPEIPSSPSRVVMEYEWPSNAWDMCLGDAGESSDARSPMQELFMRGLLAPIPPDMESEQQASWQAGRAFRTLSNMQGPMHPFAEQSVQENYEGLRHL